MPVKPKTWVEALDGNYVLQGDCWIWTRYRRNGYGMATGNGTQRYAHRVSYELFVGPIPEAHEIDHLCRNKLCLNPTHLEAVTHRENVRRGNGWAGLKARQTHCKRGHALSGPNLYVDPTGRRACRECRRLRRAGAV